MRSSSFIIQSFGLACLLALGACGGAASGPPAESAADDESKATAAADKPGAESEPAEEEKEAPPTVARQPARTILLEPETVFMLDFAASELGQKKTEQCEKSHADDPPKRAKCLTKARNSVSEEGMRFKQDPDGKWWWVTFGKVGGKAVDLSRIEFEEGEATEESLTIKLKGPDKGRKPIGQVPGELVISVPTDYRVELTHPRDGKKVYKVTVGTVDETE